MILRILGEGQLEVSDDALLELNELDEVLIARRRQGRRGAVPDRPHRTWSTRSVPSGSRWPTTTSGPSEFILPGADATLDEVRELLSDEGLIPG